MKIGDRIYVHGYVDEIRKDCVIIRNDGGYFGTVKSEIVEAQKAEDIVLVRHGHWEDCSNGWMCSECERESQKETNYCPHCGAKMERWMQRGKEE